MCTNRRGHTQAGRPTMQKTITSRWIDDKMPELRVSCDSCSARMRKPVTLRRTLVKIISGLNDTVVDHCFHRLQRALHKKHGHGTCSSLLEFKFLSTIQK